MSFYTQRLANRFPRWSKLRSDPSSLGQRMFSAFADIVEEETINSRWYSESWAMTKPWYGLGAIYAVILDEDDYFPLGGTSAGNSKYSLPSVVEGTDGFGTWPLTKADTVQELANSAPDRITIADSEPYSNIVAYDSTVGVFNPVPTERYALVVGDSTNYYPKTNRRNPKASGLHRINLFGYDENFIKFDEAVNVLDDGVHMTKEWYSSLYDIDSEGFDGDFQVKLPMQLPFIVDPYRALALEDVEGPLRLYLETDAESHVRMITTILKMGELYRRGPGVVIPSNLDELGSILLRDKDDNPIDLVDIAIGHENAKLYAIDTAGFMHVFDWSLPSFVPPVENLETVDSYIELQPVVFYPQLNEDSRMWTYFARKRFPIDKISIRRVAPDGTEAWLDDTMTWQGTEQFIDGKEDPDTVEESWTDISFSTVYDQDGQWDFYCTTHANRGVTVYQTSVQVAKLVAESSLDTGIANPVGCYWSQRGKFAVADATDIYYIQEFVDKYVPDFSNQEILCSTPYTSVEVTY